MGAKCLTRLAPHGPAPRAVLAPIVGHAGDGNLHVCFIIDPDDAGEMARSEALNERMVMRALKVALDPENPMNPGKMLRV